MALIPSDESKVGRKRRTRKEKDRKQGKKGFYYFFHSLLGELLQLVLLLDTVEGMAITGNKRAGTEYLIEVQQQRPPGSSAAS